MNIKQSAESVNSLISIHNDRIKAYELAVRDIKDPTLRSVFDAYARHSREAKQELIHILTETQSATSDGGLPLGILYRLWLDIRSRHQDRRMIIASCLVGERIGLNRYNEVLSDSIDNFTINQYKTIYRQYIAMKEDLRQLLSLEQLLPL